MREQDDILILGLGNALLADDGVGVHAIWELQKEPLPGVTMVDIGTAVRHALPFVEKARRVLVIDALLGGGAAGTIYRLALAEVAIADWRFSNHSLGLREALLVLAPDRLPPPITVIGVEPQNLSYGMELSAPVAGALPKVTALVRAAVSAWRADAAPAALGNFNLEMQGVEIC